MVRVGIVSFNPRTSPFWRAFEQWMRELGYVDGRNLAIEFVDLNGRFAALGRGDQGGVGRKADVVIASGAEIALKSALAATDALPIVMIAINYDPIALGYVCSNSSNCRCVHDLTIDSEARGP
jgi:putative ABC transport system substrate-binding protein